MSSDTKRVLVIVPTAGQPRFSKRIDMMLAHGHQVHLAAFEREYHKGRMPNCEITYIGKIEHKQYLKRIPKLFAAIFKLRALLKQSDVVYAMGTDLILLSMLAGVGLKLGRFLEIGDLREIQTRKSKLGEVFRKLDSFICKRLDFLVVTAPSFLNVYYREWVGAKTPAILLENKVEPAQADAIKKVLEETDSSVSQTSVRLGYFGLLQSRWSWRVLKLLAKEHPDTHEILLAGFPLHLDDFDEVAQSTENITFFGEYKSPDDLPELYGRIDLSLACCSPLRSDDWNVRWLRSNRFYEACAYEKPLLSREGSDEALVVAKYDIGYVIEDEDERTALEKIAAITPEQIAVWKKNMQDLPRSVYAYTDESKQLSDAIIKSAN